MDFARIAEVIVVVLFTSAGQLLLRQGMRNIGEGANGLTDMIGHILQTPILWLAIGLYGFSTLLWLRVVSRYPVSAVYPMVAIGYIFVTIGGLIFLNERVSLQGWIALAVICAGTLLLAAAPAQPTV